ncbi:hypothetical protein [Paenibacillus piri]|uniref:Uncharacterized protein n=1 Tax=Paenibacillus piri TaxID=2547395 RepID=A0A4R5L078_9BACL|nr:hypothetical protein [Paenibacillus piri]TDG00878.1 hypothetical protein E1757_04510 [Paenibacillus piri]
MLLNQEKTIALEEIFHFAKENILTYCQSTLVEERTYYFLHEDDFNYQKVATRFNISVQSVIFSIHNSSKSLFSLVGNQIMRIKDAEHSGIVQVALSEFREITKPPLIPFYGRFKPSMVHEDINYDLEPLASQAVGYARKYFEETGDQSKLEYLTSLTNSKKRESDVHDAVARYMDGDFSKSDTGSFLHPADQVIKMFEWLKAKNKKVKTGGVASAKNTQTIIIP